MKHTIAGHAQDQTTDGHKRENQAFMCLSASNLSDFCAALSKWGEAVAAGRLGDAASLSQEMLMYGDLIRIHPDFLQVFQVRCPDREPLEILQGMGAFLESIAAAVAAEAAKHHAAPEPMAVSNAA